MAQSKKVAADSSESTEPTTDVAEVVEATIVDADTQAAVERVGAFIDRKGYGPNTTRIIGYIAERSFDESDLNVVIMEQLAERLLNATSAEDILTPFDPHKGAEWYGKILYIEGCSFIESDFEGFPWYVSLQCKNPQTGETWAVTIGGEKVVMQAAAFDRNGLWPTYVVITPTEKETKAGFHPLEMRPVDPFKDKS